MDKDDESDFASDREVRYAHRERVNKGKAPDSHWFKDNDDVDNTIE